MELTFEVISSELISLDAELDKSPASFVSEVTSDEFLEVSVSETVFETFSF